MTALSPLRQGRITGSRVGAILGLNPYSTRDDVLREMVREVLGAPREFTGNVMTQWGTDHEPEALARYSEQTGVFVEDAGFIVRPEYLWLGVTPDGMVGDDGMVEVKCPYRGTYTNFNGHPHYRAQVQLQLACTGRAWCDCAVLDRAGNLHISRIMADPNWLKDAAPTLERFMADYHAAIADPARHLTDKDRDDDEWAVAALTYRAACDACDAADAAKEAARAALLALAGESSAKGAGVTVTRSERAGSIAYAKAVKDLLPDADLSAYAGKPSIVFTITKDK